MEYSKQPGITSKHVARKRFGQNFLIDQGIIQALIRAIGVANDDLIIEIGPGRGALTRPLLAEAKTMTAIELDRDLIDQLQLLSGLTVINQDILTVDVRQLMKADKKVRLVGNLPYNISTPIIFHLLSFCSAIKDMHFMLQKEVVERIAAQPGSRTYGRLSVMVQRYCTVEPLILIPPEAFDPQPQVVSQFMRLTPHAADPVSISDEQVFGEVVKAAFAMKRKTLRNNLKGWLEIADIDACGVDASARAETLSLEAFARLANQVVLKLNKE